METKRPTIPEAEELLDRYFPVLDHGFVALKDYMGGDGANEEAARTSYRAKPRKKSDTEGLLRYMRRNRHTSPFEMTEIKLHCGMPLFVARQWVRHRTASLNEMSGRYSIMPMVFYTPEPQHILRQSKTNKQGRDGGLKTEEINDWTKGLWSNRKDTQNLYEWATANDFAKELARIDLPLSTYTHWFWKIDLHNLLHFLGLRCEEHAQWEMRQYANVIAGMTKRLAPISFQAWLDYQFDAVTFSRMEMEIIRQGFEVTKLGVRSPVVYGTDRPAEEWSLKELERILGTQREVEEFLGKLRESSRTDFILNMSKALEPEHFEQMWRT